MSDFDKGKTDNNNNQTKVLSNSEQFLLEMLKNKKDYSDTEEKLKSNYSVSTCYYSNDKMTTPKVESNDSEEKIFDSEKEKCDKLFREALEYSRNTQYFKAIPILKEILAISPNNLLLINKLCYCLFEQNKTKEAKELAYKGLELAQSFSSKFYIPKFYSIIARFYKKVSDFKTAIKYYKLALVRDYFNLEIIYSLADCYMKNNEYDEALNLFKRVRASDNEEDDKMGFLKLKEYAVQQNKKAHPELAHIELGDKYFSNKQNKLALIEYESAHKIVPEDIRVLEKLFDTQIKLGLKQEAIKTGLEITSKDIDTIKKYYDGHGELILLSKVYSELYNYYKNTWHFIKTKEASSMFDYYQKILRGQYEYAFNKSKCILNLKVAYESKPNRYEALEKLIVYLSLFKEYEESIKYASIGLAMAKAEKNINKIFYFCELLADDFNEIKNYEKTLYYYNLALQHTQDNQKKLRIYGLMICCYREIGNLEQFSVCVEKSKNLIEAGTEDFADTQSLIVEEKAKSDKNSDYCKSIDYLNKGLELFQNKKYQEALNEFKESYYLNSQNLNLLETYSKCLNLSDYSKEAQIIANEGYEIANRDYNQEYIKIFQQLICDCSGVRLVY